jgi:hypothetical protein
MREYLKLFAIAFSFICINAIHSRLVAWGYILADIPVGLVLSFLWWDGIQMVSKKDLPHGRYFWAAGASLGTIVGILTVRGLYGH